MYTKLTVLLLLAAACCFPVFGEEVTMQPKGVYATINTASSLRAIEALRSDAAAERAKAVQEVTSHSDRYCPAVFFSLATALFEAGKTDDALFWLYAGRIRTQFDIRRCTDETVSGGYEELNASVPDLLKLIQFENMDNTKKIVEKALEWDRRTPYNYDPRWIALHGMGAVMSAVEGNKQKETALTIPEKDWPALAEKHRQEYWEGYQADMADITPEQLAQIRAKIKVLSQEAVAGNK